MDGENVIINTPPDKAPTIKMPLWKLLFAIISGTGVLLLLSWQAFNVHADVTGKTKANKSSITLIEKKNTEQDSRIDRFEHKITNDLKRIIKAVEK